MARRYRDGRHPRWRRHLRQFRGRLHFERLGNFQLHLLRQNELQPQVRARHSSPGTFPGPFPRHMRFSPCEACRVVTPRLPKNSAYLRRKTALGHLISRSAISDLRPPDGTGLIAKVVAAKHLQRDSTAADVDVSHNSSDFRKIGFRGASLTDFLAMSYVAAKKHYLPAAIRGIRTGISLPALRPYCKTLSGHARK
jgi:hypothetical protein